MTGFNLSENAKSEPVRVHDDKKIGQQQSWISITQPFYFVVLKIGK
jgi:hypothetical protein